jgi:hypothetical protein
MRRYLIFTFLLTWNLQFVHAQSGQDGLEDWNPGYLVTNDEDTLYGPVSLLYHTDQVQVNDENRVMTFGANQVIMVYLRDRDNPENERYIYPFPYHPYSDFKPQRFFEMLFSGIHLSLLCREILITETIPMYDNFTFRTYFSTRTRLQREYYLMFPEKKVRLFTARKKDVLVQLADKKEAIKKFFATQNIDLDKQEDVMKIVKEYNRLKAEK